MKRHDQGTYEYLRHHKRFPHVLCAGCGIGEAMDLLRAGEHGIALSKIAFVSNVTGTKQIYVMDYDGENRRRICSATSRTDASCSFFAACSTPAQPPRTITSASDTFLPPDCASLDCVLNAF